MHCFTCTVNAVIRTRRRDKIRLFAKLLRNSLGGNDVSDPDEYEFLLSVLDALSLKELAILQAIENYEKEYYKDGKFSNEEQSHEGLLLKEVEKHLAIDEGKLRDKELMGLVIRLNRTGCYTMMGWRNGPAKDCRLTDVYFKLKKLISQETV